MTAQIVVAVALARADALATNVGSILKHRGANAVPAFATRARAGRRKARAAAPSSTHGPDLRRRHLA
jgi:hypothetical protein